MSHPQHVPEVCESAPLVSDQCSARLNQFIFHFNNVEYQLVTLCATLSEFGVSSTASV